MNNNKKKPREKEEEQNEDMKDSLNTDDNVTYNVWSFGNMRMLIRCKIHGFIRDASITSVWLFISSFQFH